MLDIEFTLDEIIERTLERSLSIIEFHIYNITSLTFIENSTLGHNGVTLGHSGVLFLSSSDVVIFD